jgi:hypothetical protein
VFVTLASWPRATVFRYVCVRMWLMFVVICSESSGLIGALVGGESGGPLSSWVKSCGSSVWICCSFASSVGPWSRLRTWES